MACPVLLIILILAGCGGKEGGTLPAAASNDFASGIAVDGSGNVYVTGTTVDTNTGDADCLLVRYAPDGTKLRIQKFGTEFDDIATGIAVDGSGGIYVTGTTYGGLDGSAHGEDADFIVVKYDADGNKIWTRQFGTGFNDYAIGIAVDGSGNIYVTGFTYGSFDGYTNAGDADFFVVKYDTNGNRTWMRQFGTELYDFTTGIAVDGSGNIYVTGYTCGGLDGNTNAGGVDSFVVKYAADGTKLWTQQFGTSLNDYATGIVVDGSGNISVAGYTYGDLAGTGNAGRDDVFVVKYNASGDRVWTQQCGTESSDSAASIAVDNSGSIYTTGYTYGVFDGSTNAGRSDFFVVKYDTDGNRMWTQQFGTAFDDAVSGIAVDNGNNIYVTGTTYGSLDENANAGGADLFVVKYSADGTKQ